MEFSGTVETTDEGQLEFHADAGLSGFYIVGRDGLSIVDLIGMLMFFGISLGVSVHGPLTIDNIMADSISANFSI